MPDADPVLRIGREIAEGLDASRGATGRVHSVFARAINIEWSGGDWPGGRLLALHGPGSLLAPFAAAVDCIAALRALPIGTPVVAQPARLRAGSLDLTWARSERVNCSIEADGSAGPPSADWLLARSPHAAGLDSTAGRAAREGLAAGIRHRDQDRLIAAAQALLGLGEGLTPAGDDCLVGALAVLHRVGASWLRGGPSVTAALAAAARERTTPIGREFVLHALAGRFSEPLLAVLRAASRDEARHAVSRLLRLGATSGADTLSGMRLACLALAA